MLKITPLGTDTAAWDNFVRAHPQGSFFHLAAWRGIFEKAFNHKTFFVAAEQDGAIVGILPLAQVKTRLFGHTLISSPFCVYGGPLAVEAAASVALARYAVDLRAKLGATACEFRYLQAPEQAYLPAEWQPREGLYVTFRRAMPQGDDAVLKSIPRKQRAVVRKGIERGLTATTDQNIDVLHSIYAESVRNLGTPVFAKKYFRLLAETFGPDMDVLTVRDNATPVASVLNFYWRDEVLPYYGGGTTAARTCFANDFMYWEVMRRAAARGYKIFDFGRSKTGTGAFSFKKNWGFEPETLQYRTLLAPGETFPEVNPLNPKYRLMIATWKRLPIPIANIIGPHIVRGAG